jgi:hypothetical protein
MAVATIGSSFERLPGPNISEINGFIASLMKKRTRENCVVWDLVHDVEVSLDAVLRGLSQRVRIRGMRDDFEGFSPLHVLAIQGKLEILTEAIRISNKVKRVFQLFRESAPEKRGASFFPGQRSVLHLLALGGHNKYFGLEQDEYEGTPKDIARIVGEKKGSAFCGKWKINGPHVPAVDLLKIWVGCRPTKEFRELVANNRVQLFGLRSLPGGVFRVAQRGEVLGFAAYATRDIPENCIVGTYQGVFDPTAFSITLAEVPDAMQINSEFFPKRHTEGEYFSGMFDAEMYCSEEAFINDHVPPSISFISELARNGLMIQTRCLTLRPIKRGEFVGASYANHPMRITRDYFESSEMILERRALIQNLTKKKDGERLSRYEVFGLQSIISTPQLIFRWLKSGDLALDDLEKILRRYLMLGMNDLTTEYVSQFFIGIPKLKERDFFDLFLRQWIDPILNSRGLLIANNQDHMFRALGMAFMNLIICDKEYIEANRISFKVQRVDATNFSCEISTVAL